MFARVRRQAVAGRATMNHEGDKAGAHPGAGGGGGMMFSAVRLPFPSVRGGQPAGDSKKSSK